MHRLFRLVGTGLVSEVGRRNGSTAHRRTLLREMQMTHPPKIQTKNGSQSCVCHTGVCADTENLGFGKIMSCNTPVCSVVLR